MSGNLHELEHKLGYKFNDQKILKLATIHDSPRATNLNNVKCGRLEYIGNAVIEMVITEYLFKSLKNRCEGTMSIKRRHLVTQEKRNEIASELHLRRYINKCPNTNLIQYEKHLEAVIGAVYVDAGLGGRGLDMARPIIFKLWKIARLIK